MCYTTMYTKLTTKQCMARQWVAYEYPSLCLSHSERCLIRPAQACSISVEPLLILISTHQHCPHISLVFPSPLHTLQHHCQGQESSISLCQRYYTRGRGLMSSVTLYIVHHFSALENNTLQLWVFTVPSWGDSNQKPELNPFGPRPPTPLQCIWLAHKQPSLNPVTLWENCWFHYYIDKLCRND